MSVALAAALVVLLARLPAQEEWRPPPPRPHHRAEPVDGTGAVRFPVASRVPAARRFFAQGLGQLHAGAAFEAERAFLQAAVEDPECALAWWGAALAAARVDPERAAAHAEQAQARLEHADDRARRYVATWAPEAAERAARLHELVARFEGDVEAKALLARELFHSGGDFGPLLDAVLSEQPHHPAVRYRMLTAPDVQLAGPCRRAAPAVGAMWHAAGRGLLAAGEPATAALHLEAALRVWHAELERSCRMPFDVEGYDQAAATLCALWRGIGRGAEASDLARYLVALPRHPRQRLEVDHWERLLETPVKAAVEASDGAATLPEIDLERLGPARWTPRETKGFRLPRGDGGEYDLADHTGRPVLVVFFLGFGCVHCVDQINDLKPRAEDFREAGIDIVTIGTDTLDQVKASIQQGVENGDPPLPFPVLSDAEGVAFRRWGCWDDFTQEALHGTFLVDAGGRVRWQDIGLEPFMASDWLLDECRRLLGE